MKRVFFLLAIVTLAAVFTAMSLRRPAPPATGFLFGALDQGTTSYKYAVYVPREYDASRAWPLILFLHGSGESGNDGTRMVVQGLGSAIQWNPARWPAIVVFPQKPSQASEWEAHEDAVMKILERVRHEYNVDRGRIYLTGLSQGGHGTWVLGARHPELWAALAPVCGYGGVRHAGPGVAAATAGEIAGRIRSIPVWAFHGDADDVVPPAETTALIDALRAAGASPEPRVTIFPDVNHGSWDPAYRDTGLAEWLFAQRR